MDHPDYVPATAREMLANLKTIRKNEIADNVKEFYRLRSQNFFNGHEDEHALIRGGQFIRFYPSDEAHRSDPTMKSEQMSLIQPVSDSKIKRSRKRAAKSTAIEGEVNAFTV